MQLKGGINPSTGLPLEVGPDGMFNFENILRELEGEVK